MATGPRKPTVRERQTTEAERRLARGRTAAIVQAWCRADLPMSSLASSCYLQGVEDAYRAAEDRKAAAELLRRDGPEYVI